MDWEERFIFLFPLKPFKKLIVKKHANLLCYLLIKGWKKLKSISVLVFPIHYVWFSIQYLVWIK